MRGIDKILLDVNNIIQKQVDNIENLSKDEILSRLENIYLLGFQAGLKYTATPFKNYMQVTALLHKVPSDIKVQEQYNELKSNLENLLESIEK